MASRKNEQQPLVRIVDDDPGLRGALVFLLENEGYEVAAFADAASFLKSEQASRPGCLVSDIRMPGMTGLELQRELKSRGNPIPIIFLTAFAEVDMAVEGLKSGAVDFLQKPVHEERLLGAVEAAINADRRARQGLPAREEIEMRLRTLTERERQIVALARQGLANPVIGERLGIGLRTVKFHRASAYRKLGVHTAEELSELLLEQAS
ncbi:MAG: response regulator transcription factor [Duodenibacillus sp.]|nr:response regulator transcription factor [Duodenibacillus sp.]HBC69559.1 DNA-binding response regulator [Sutterella sp.]